MALVNAFGALGLDSTLQAIRDRLPLLSTSTPNASDSGVTVKLPNQGTATADFSSTASALVDPFFTNNTIIGSGVSCSQASGSLSIVAGTTANSEFLARSVASYKGAMRMRHGIITSQRIANNNLAFLLADLLGEGLSFTINSSTSVTVTLPGHSIDSGAVGQFVNIGGIVGAAGVPGRYAIASVVASTSITFTVSGWPASGSGTCTLFGRSYIRSLYTGTGPTNIAIDAQDTGWATGDTTATINTTASPGTLIQVETTGREVFWSDTLRASSATPTTATRGSRYENIPTQSIDLYVFVWMFNGSTAPASSTTYTIGFVSVETYPNRPMPIGSIRSIGQQNHLPVQLQTGSNTVGAVNIASSQTLATVTTVSSAALATNTIVADVASAALTTTTTTSAITPGAGLSYSVNIPVTAVTGTTPTLDVVIQESDDSGTNWFDVYHFPRITTTGIYRSPKLGLFGNRVRYVQTVGGTTPSFTRAVNRMQSSDTCGYIRQLIDRTINTTSANATTSSLVVQNCRAAQLIISLGAATTPPALQLEGSDDNGLTWYLIGTSLTGSANASVQSIVLDVNFQLLRARVTTAGSGVTLGFVLVKGF